MATFVLGAIGTAIAGPFGGFIGASIGGAIDNFLIFPALFPPPDVTGPKADSLQPSSGNEGTPSQFLLGPMSRVAGNVIWLGEREEVENKKKVGGISGSGGSATSYSYFQSVAIKFGEVTPGASLYQAIAKARKVFADAKLVWDNGALAYYDDITWYYGGQSAADPLMEGVLGAGQVPIYKDTVYCVIERLYLDEYGVGRMPNLMATLAHDLDVSVQDVLKIIVERAGLDPTTMLDVSRLPFCFRGMNIAGPTPTSKVIEMLSGVYGITFQEGANGKLTAFATGDEDVFDVGDDFGTDENPGVEIVRAPNWKTPTSAEVRYVSWEKDAQPGLEPYYDQGRGDTGDRVSMSVPITLKSDEAQSIAKRIVWAGRAERKTTGEFTLPPSYWYLEAGDALNLTVDGRTVTVMATSVTHGANYEVVVEGKEYDPLVYSQTSIGANDGYTNNGYTPPDTELIFMDMASPLEVTCSTAGAFFAVQTNPVGERFKGAFLYVSDDDGVTYEQAAAVTSTPQAGHVVGYTAIPVSNLFIDRANTLTVAIDSGTLSSESEAAVLKGDTNLLAVQAPSGDWEILAFTTVADAGTHDDGRQKYALSGLVRGMRGTEHLVNEHEGAAARCVVLKVNGSVGFWDLEDGAYLGVDSHVKAPAQGGTVSEYPAREVRPVGRSASPFAPWCLRWTERYVSTTTTDVEIEWTNRGKVPASPLLVAAPESDDEVHEWEVEIRTSGYLSELLATATVVEPTYNFDQASRNAAETASGTGWQEGDSFVVRVRKLSTTGAEGRWASMEVNR